MSGVIVLAILRLEHIRFASPTQIAQPHIIIIMFVTWLGCLCLFCFIVVAVT